MIGLKLGDWMFRASYNLSFAQIQPVTYQQARINDPVKYLVIQNPSLLDPLHGVAINASTRTSPIYLAKELVDSYAHQYGLTIERKFASGVQLRFGYAGSRAVKLLNNYTLNRATNVSHRSHNSPRHSELAATRSPRSGASARHPLYGCGCSPRAPLRKACASRLIPEFTRFRWLVKHQ